MLTNHNESILDRHVNKLMEGIGDLNSSPVHDEDWMLAVRVMIREHLHNIAWNARRVEAERSYGIARDAMDQMKDELRRLLDLNPESNGQAKCRQCGEWFPENNDACWSPDGVCADCDERNALDDEEAERDSILAQQELEDFEGLSGFADPDVERL